MMISKDVALKFLKLEFLIIPITIALIYFREPMYFLKPRLWAEEGTVYIQSYLDNGFTKSFFLDHLGYYSLFNKLAINGGMEIFGFGNIAVVTTFSSLCITFIVTITPVIFKSDYWDTTTKRILLILVSLILSTEEMWINTINIQFYLGLFTSYMLLVNYKENDLNFLQKILIYILIGLGAATGITSIIFTPFFLYSYYKTKSKVIRNIGIILIIGCLIQFIALIHSSHSGAVAQRFAQGNLHNIPEAVIWCLRFSGKHDWLPFALMTFMSIIYFFGFIYWIYKTRKNMFLLFLSLYITLIFSLLSLGMEGAPRYFFMPCVLLSLMLITQLNEEYMRPLCLCLIGWIFLKSIDYFNADYYKHAWTSFKPELERIKATGDTDLRIFPQDTNPKWVIVIRDKSALGR